MQPILPQFNWIDLATCLVVIYFILQGWQQGLISLLASFASFLLSLWLAIKYNLPVGNFITEKFGLPGNWAMVLGYLIIGFLSELILNELFNYFLQKLPDKIWSSKLNHAFGAVISFLNGLLIIVFILFLILALPLRGSIKKDVQNSFLADRLVKFSRKYGGIQLESLINKVNQEAIKFLTVEPASSESLKLDIAPTAKDLSEDPQIELEMFKLVNQERVKAGKAKLVFDAKLTSVAAAYARDMFLRRYFSHYSPEGEDVSDRLKQAGISYHVAGENLAYAPDVATAHQGLMDSPGHRKNILDPEFYRVGIGVVDSRIYGQMYVQIFTN